MRASHLQSHLKTIDTHMKRGALLAATLLLSACAGMPSFTSGDDASSADARRADARRAEAAAKYASTGPANPKRMRLSSRDIMTEWATRSRDRSPYRQRRGLGTSPLDDVIPEPDITTSIQEMMATAECNSCDEKPYHEMVVKASARYGVPTSLIHAVIQKESGYNPAARSNRHARGLMQVTPATARFVGFRNSKRLYDPQTNIYAGTAYLKYLIANHTTFDEVLAAYNAGPGNVRKYKGVPPFRETRRYVRDVKRLYAVSVR